jgi:hypothetical protein
MRALVTRGLWCVLLSRALLGRATPQNPSRLHALLHARARTTRSLRLTAHALLAPHSHPPRPHCTCLLSAAPCSVSLASFPSLHRLAVHRLACARHSGPSALARPFRPTAPAPSVAPDGPAHDQLYVLAGFAYIDSSRLSAPHLLRPLPSTGRTDLRVGAAAPSRPFTALPPQRDARRRSALSSPSARSHCARPYPRSFPPSRPRSSSTQTSMKI